ncbi:unnamed protein product [Didymodactylos carnosus]|uniref:Vezatin n=1 Tax=Didymodactylos carnosus TaxID=1234261 RepID=A0A8S2F7N4_9BILA|nr:unnamed protein product [Didymodactylos carnosus]CAF4169538.1 unnamed protein product [Didymodactylos carnosus]
MNDFDEDIDPYGPLADLMTDHNLSSPITKKTIIKEQQQQFDLTKTNHSLLNEVKIVLSKNFNVYFNVHLLFKYIFSYFLSSQWHHIHRILEVNDIDELADYENNKQKLRKRASSSIKKLFIVCMWSLYLSNLKVYFQIIQSNQTWMSQISGFQLIRPTTSSSLLDTKLFSLRHALFSQLRQCFLHTYQASRSLTAMIEWMKSDYDHLSCHIDLNEFGPILSSSNNDTLNELTNKYDLSAINSTKKLCLTQIHEYIQLMQFYMLDILQIRAGSQTASLLKVIKDIKNLNDLLTVSIEEIQIVRQKCSLIDYVDNLSPNSVIQVSSKFRSASVLLRLCCEQLFEIDRQNMISVDENILTRIIYDIKTACHFIEDIRGKQVVTSENPHLFSAQHTKEDAENQVTSFYRYDDKPLEYVDEVLTCDTGTEQSALEERNTTEVDYDQKFLTEQTKSLMNELRNAIETKKQEWNEREEKLLNIKPTNSSEIVEKVIHHETEPLVESMQPFITQHEINKNCSMLDELKQTFVINKEKMNLNEDVFGEEEDEDEDQDDDDDDEISTTCFDDARQDQSGPALIRYLADKSNETYV